MAGSAFGAARSSIPARAGRGPPFFWCLPSRLGRGVFLRALIGLHPEAIRLRGLAIAEIGGEQGKVPRRAAQSRAQALAEAEGVGQGEHGEHGEHGALPCDGGNAPRTRGLPRTKARLRRICSA